MKKSLKVFKRSLFSDSDSSSQPLVSVIIPAHNEEHTIRDMLKCLKAQTYSRIEVIVVDDGSDDRTFKVASRYKAFGKTFMAYKQPKSGVSAARNLGLSMAKGKYICFFDADDYVPENAIEKMAECAEKRSADLVIGQMRVTTTGSSDITKFTQALSEKKNIGKLNRNIIFSTSLANKLFRLDIIRDNHIEFKDYISIEDGCFVFEYLVHCSKITGCPYEVYHYTKKPFWEGSSLTHTYSYRQLADSEKACDDILRSAEVLIRQHELSEPPDLSDEEKQLNIEKRERYLSVVNRRAIKQCIKHPYRHIWLAEPDTLEKLQSYYSKYFNAMLPVDKDIHLRQDADLKMERGIRSKQDFVDNPLISVIISRFGDYCSSELAVQRIVEGYYMQDFPSFELIVDDHVASMLTEEQLARDNLFVSDRLSAVRSFDDLIQMAPEVCRSEYVILAKESFIPGNRTLKDMFNEIGSDDCIYAPLLVQKGHSFVQDTAADPSIFMSNRLVRTSSLGKDSCDHRMVSSTFIHLL